MGGRKGIRPVKLSGEVLAWKEGASVCSEVQIYLHVVQLMPLPPHHLLLQQNPEWFTFLVPAYPGCPGKKAVKTDVVVIFYKVVYRRI